MIERVTLLHGNCTDVLRSLPAESVHCCVTSPPYWGLRDYGNPPTIWGGDAGCAHEWGEEVIRGGISGGPSAIPNEEHGKLPTFGRLPESRSAFCRHCGAWRGCLGLEPTPEAFIAHTVEVFREVRRVLRKDGTLWLNIGDSYAGSTQSGGDQAGRCDGGVRQLERQREQNCGVRTTAVSGLKPKDLVGMPWEVALALRRDGWWLRADCIWSKANPMPESVRDRPTRSHEFVFLLAKSERYFYDADAVRERTGSEADPAEYAAIRAENGGWTGPDATGAMARQRTEGKFTGTHPAGRNLRSVWHLPTQPFAEAHFATYPERLVEPCIKAGTSEHGCCPECGAPWRRLTKVTYEPGYRKGHLGHAYRGTVDGMDDRSDRPALDKHVETLGWEPSCACGCFYDPAPCTVLDPFGGSGTTALVAAKLGRLAVHIDQSAEYLDIARKRLRADQPGLLI